MSGSDVTIKRSKGDSTLVRPRFGPGMLLQHEDLEGLGSYPRDLSRLLFRSFFGCGVVCGLVVETEVRCGKVYVTVGAGLALGCSGDPIHVPKDHHFAIDEECDPNLPTPLWVVLCGTTKCCAPRPSGCGDDDEAPSVCTRERDGFEIRIVRERPACACGCPEIWTGNPPSTTPPQTGGGDDRFVAAPPEPRVRDCSCVEPTDLCYADHYAGRCGCTCGDCSDCDCQCVLLARLDRIDEQQRFWRADHKVRRFIRPVLMRDPQVEIEAQAATQAAARLAKEAEEEAAWRELEAQRTPKRARTLESTPAPETAAAAKTFTAARTDTTPKPATTPKTSTAPKPTTRTKPTTTPKTTTATKPGTPSK
jgi:hypothetical protein